MWIQIIEWTGVGFGILSVIYAARGSIYTWPVGILSCIAYIFFHYYCKLYSSMWLQVFYIITCVVGWYEWKKVNPKDEGGVRRIPTIRYAFYLPAIVISSIILGKYVDHNTDDPKPYLDVVATVLSVAGQWFLIRKYIENWFVWIVADSVYCYLFLVQKNYPSLILFTTYLVFAVIGYIQWKRLQKKSLSA